MVKITGNVLADLQGLPVINRSFSLQANWYIDPEFGDDENNGATDLTALKTWAELRRRMLACGGHEYPDTHIYILGDLLDDDVLIIDWGCKSRLPVRIWGVPSVVRSGSFTSQPTQRNPELNQPNIIKDSNISSWDNETGALSGKILWPTSGNAVNSPAWITRDLGNNEARVTTFLSVETGEEVFPDNGDTYDILEVPFIRNYNIAPTSGFFLFKHLNIGDELSEHYHVQPSTATGGTQFTYCALYYLNMSSATAYLFNCVLKSAPFLYAGADLQFFGGYARDIYNFGMGEIETGAELIQFNGTIFEDFNMFVINLGYARLYDGMAFNAPGNGAWVVGQAGFMRIEKLSGNENLGFGMNITNTGVVWGVISQIKITGNDGDVNFCGNVYSWNEIQEMKGVESGRGFACILNSYEVETPLMGKVGILKVIENIDLTIPGITQLIKGIDGKMLDILDIRLIVTLANSVISFPDLQVGKAGSNDDWANMTNLNNLNQVGQIVSLSELTSGSIRSVYNAGEIINLEVIVPAQATDLKVKAIIIGYVK